MKTLEWTNTDKSDWPEGEWKYEPDKRQWLDEETGLPCLIVRGPSGALCGYVGVGKDHPFYQLDYSNEKLWGIDVHGGLTFSNHCYEPSDPSKKDPSKYVCHLVEDGEEDKVWWLGFDCAHSGDMCPGRSYRLCFGDDTYKSLNYVMSECELLAAQLERAA